MGVILKKIKRLGLAKSVIYFASIPFSYVLWIFFKFHKWHITAGSFYSRAYKQGVVDLANSTKSKTVIDIGCGLGSILKNIHAEKRIGFDIDEGAISCARFLHPATIQFKSISNLSEIDWEDSNSCVIMTNWMHDLDPSVFQKLIKSVLEKSNYLILDLVTPGTPGYNHHHKLDFISTEVVILKEVHFEGEPRTFLLLKKLTTS